SQHETVASNLKSDNGSGISPSSPYHSLLYRTPWSAAARPLYNTRLDWTPFPLLYVRTLVPSRLLPLPDHSLPLCFASLAALLASCCSCEEAVCARTLSRFLRLSLSLSCTRTIVGDTLDEHHHLPHHHLPGKKDDCTQLWLLCRRTVAALCCTLNFPAPFLPPPLSINQLLFFRPRCAGPSTPPATSQFTTSVPHLSPRPCCIRLTPHLPLDHVANLAAALSLPVIPSDRYTLTSFACIERLA
ncbi:hypothetical protein CGCVW01_v003832, partial [Colletotrichum viniferum]